MFLVLFFNVEQHHECDLCPSMYFNPLGLDQYLISNINNLVNIYHLQSELNGTTVTLVPYCSIPATNTALTLIFTDTTATTISQYYIYI